MEVAPRRLTHANLNVCVLGDKRPIISKWPSLHLAVKILNHNRPSNLTERQSQRAVRAKVAAGDRDPYLACSSLCLVPRIDCLQRALPVEHYLGARRYVFVAGLNESAYEKVLYSPPLLHLKLEIQQILSFEPPAELLRFISLGVAMLSSYSSSMRYFCTLHLWGVGDAIDAGKALLGVENAGLVGDYLVQAL